MWPQLGEEWAINQRWYDYFDKREGTTCRGCSSSLRVRHLASVALKSLDQRLGIKAACFSQLIGNQDFQKLRIAEINSIGQLHQHISTHPLLRYSEFNSSDPSIPSEDLCRLSYDGEQFDLILTSDTLEHVPDIDQALAEILRVLRRGGLHIFTIPVVWDRATRQRARAVNGKVIHELPPSYHGAIGSTDFLVFYEFGQDVVGRIRDAGFSVEIHIDSRNPSVSTFVSSKP